MIAFHQFHCHTCLFHCLCLGHCLCKEIHAYLKPSLSCAGNIIFKIRVFHQNTGRRTSISHSDNRKLNPCSCHCLPVNFTLPFRNVNSICLFCFNQRAILTERIFHISNRLLPCYRVMIGIKVIQFSVNRLPSRVAWTAIKNFLCMKIF